MEFNGTVETTQDSSSSGSDDFTSSLEGLSVNEMTSEDYTIDAYAHHHIHEDMLKDEARIIKFRDAMFHNRHLFKGKTVLDVGCGTGILSLFAVQAGAAKVIGIDSSKVIEHTRTFVAELNLDHVINVIQGKVEDATLPQGVDKVDIIVSGWMGPCLLHESMLEVVLTARDKWLKPGGLIFPDKASLFIIGIDDRKSRAQRLAYWNEDVYKHNMKAMRRAELQVPSLHSVALKNVVTVKDELIQLNLTTMKKDDINFSVPFLIKAQRDGYISALATFFKVDFSACHKPIAISTAPDATCTGWGQTVFHLNGQMAVKEDEAIYGQFNLSIPNGRHVDVAIQVDFLGACGQLQEDRVYYMR